jgi:hypothetical protein
MCESKQKCQRPDQLKGKPGECSPEQIEKCHGKDTSHPCVTENPEK